MYIYILYILFIHYSIIIVNYSIYIYIDRWLVTGNFIKKTIVILSGLAFSQPVWGWQLNFGEKRLLEKSANIFERGNIKSA